MTKYFRLKILLAVILGALAFGVYVYYRWFDSFPPNERMIIGVSFSSEHARWLGLEPRAVLAKLFTENGFRRVRFAAQWNSVERAPGVYDFSDLDDLMKIAAANGGQALLALGQKTPRWPECHLPEWVIKLSSEERRLARLQYIRATVERYREHPALEMWQVENEPFLRWFADCPPMSRAELAEELALVVSLDPKHPTLTSDSGELSSWRQSARAADFFGTTLYRVVYNKYLGYWNYDWLPPVFYRAKFFFNRRPLTTAFITELQAEPWLPNGGPGATSLPEQYRSMNLARLRYNISYARRIGVARAYLWGAEWWAWLEGKGERELTDYIKALPKK